MAWYTPSAPEPEHHLALTRLNLVTLHHRDMSKHLHSIIYNLSVKMLETFQTQKAYRFIAGKKKIKNPSWIIKKEPWTVWCSTNKKNPPHKLKREGRWVRTRGFAAGIAFPCAASEPHAAQWPRVTLSERGYYRAFITAGGREAATPDRLLFFAISDVYFKQPLGNITAHEFFIFNMTQICSRTRLSV